jgi:hypothetical protein
LKIMDQLRAGAVLALFCGVGSAATLLNVTDQLVGIDLTQMGRLSRNNIIQDWVGTEPFPGVINPTTAYIYNTYSVNVGSNSFIQITIDDVSTNEFASAYLGAYLPNSAGAPNFGFDTNWLGDAGGSGNFFGVDPRFFQVIVPPGSNLVVVVNNTTGSLAGAGTFNLLVEGFADANFDDVPEPASVILMTSALGVLGLALLKRRKRTYNPTSL